MSHIHQSHCRELTLLTGFWSIIGQGAVRARLGESRASYEVQNKMVRVGSLSSSSTNGVRPSVLRHELVFQLQALIQEQRRLDKSHDTAVAPPKVKEMFEVPLVLSPDDTNRKQRQTTKNIYQMKGRLDSARFMVF